MSYYKATVFVLVRGSSTDMAKETVSEALRNLCLDDGSSGFVAWEFDTDNAPHRVSTSAVEDHSPDLYDVPLKNLL